jgi:hypothetical protein
MDVWTIICIFKQLLIKNLFFFLENKQHIFFTIYIPTCITASALSKPINKLMTSKPKSPVDFLYTPLVRAHIVYNTNVYMFCTYRISPKYSRVLINCQVQITAGENTVSFLLAPGSFNSHVYVLFFWKYF